LTSSFSLASPLREALFNGRVGRLLITFMLCAKEVLREPILYLSLFFS
jgi:hypothetical protein